MVKLRRLAPIARWLLLVVLVVLGGWYGVRHPEIFTALRSMTLSHVALSLVFVFTARWALALQLRTLSGCLGVRLGVWESFGLVMINTMYSYLAPGRAGLGAQGLYLKKKHALSFAHFGSLVAASNLLQAFATASMTLVVAVIGRELGAPVPTSVLIGLLTMLGVIVAAGTALGVFMGLAHRVPTKTLRSLCVRMSEGIRMLWGRKGVLLIVLGLGVVRLAGLSGLLWMACSSVGLSVGIVPATAMTAFAVLGLLLPLTPGSLGVSEGIISGIGELWGFPLETLLLAALVRRAIAVVFTFSLGTVATYLLTGGLRNPTQEGYNDAQSRTTDAEPKKTGES